MKWRFVFPLLFIIFVLPSSALSVELLKGKVVGVKDGDTIEILIKKKSYNIRFHGVDSPEKNQAFGQKAKRFVSDRVFGKKVKVLVWSEDRNGRKVGEVFYRGSNLNEEIVAAGMAWVDHRFTKDIGLSCLEKSARESKKGLWIDPNPIPPWKFRKKKKTPTSSSP